MRAPVCARRSSASSVPPAAADVRDIPASDRVDPTTAVARAGLANAAAFAAAMAALGPFEPSPSIAVGVSGGPDSMALALLLRDWVAACRGSLSALVVDHRLRPESTAEAELTVARLAALGITARILTRAGPPLASGLQAKARAARYALLEAAAAEAGILHLALAHHHEDQRETVALRLACGSGPRGAAGMPAIRELDRVRLIRPLLGCAAASLRALLDRHRVPWLTDPSNHDPRFWRARHRQARPARPTAPPPSAAAAARMALDTAVAAILARHALPHPAGFVTIEAAPLLAQRSTVLQTLLERLVLATSGQTWPPGRAQLARLAAWIRAEAGLQRQTARRTTLGGVLIERVGPALRFVREPRAVLPPTRLPRGGMLWDGRFRITRNGPDPALEVAAAGRGWRRRLARTALSRVHLDEAERLPAVVVETWPLVRSNERPILLGSWPLDPLADGLTCRYRPRSRLAAVPFGQSVSTSVASLGENLMYGKACGEASGQWPGNGAAPELDDFMNATYEART